MEFTTQGGATFRIHAQSDPRDDRACMIRIEPVDAGEAHSSTDESGSMGACTRLSGCSDADGLTSREAEVLRCVAEGYTNAEIADELCISLSTVKSHLQSIFSKWNVSNRTMLANKYHDSFAS